MLKISKPNTMSPPLHNTYADFLEKNNRWQEAFEHRQKSLDAIAPLEINAETIPITTSAEFFSFYSKFARAAAHLGKKDLAEKYIRKAESFEFPNRKNNLPKCKIFIQRDFVALGDADTILR